MVRGGLPTVGPDHRLKPAGLPFELPRGASVEWHITAGLPDDGEPDAAGNSGKDDKKLREGTTEYGKMMAARVGKKLN